jgi:hemolysin III
MKLCKSGTKLFAASRTACKLGNMISTLERYLLEPVNSLTHLFGVIASLAGLFLLVFLTWGEPGKMISLVIYGLCMAVLFLASTLLHGARLPEMKRLWLLRLDHAAIFSMIAGTYTPIIYNLFPDNHWKWLTLGGIWLVTAGGIVIKMVSADVKGFLNRLIYPRLGWGGVLPALLVSDPRELIPFPGLILLLLGGVIYTIGFVIYYRQRPDPWPNVFGHHEIWHLFVLAASFCHFLFMVFFIVPA